MSGIHWRKYFTVVITLDSCTHAFVVVIKHTDLFAEFRKRSLNLHFSQNRRLEETKAISLFRSQNDFDTDRPYHFLHFNVKNAHILFNSNIDYINFYLNTTIPKIGSVRFLFCFLMFLL